MYDCYYYYYCCCCYYYYDYCYYCRAPRLCYLCLCLILPCARATTT